MIKHFKNTLSLSLFCQTFMRGTSRTLTKDSNTNIVLKESNEETQKLEFIPPDLSNFSFSNEKTRRS